ncbi:MAG: sulfotransferase domain-containing protein [Proteobacteria bacterium]|nr:sulfotransferase domain-containing protein [Pseudomonadota bacterium]
MVTPGIAWPQKTREIHNHHMDSTFWNGFEFRPDDIIIGTHIKSGTTWVQQIVSQLIWKGATGLPVAQMSPWIDLRIPGKKIKLAAIKAQSHRRFMKTHLPVDALVFSPMAKYIYIARDGRDIVWSLYNHHTNASDYYYEAVNDTPGRIGPPLGKPADSARQYFLDWLDRDGHPYWPFWENIYSWWNIRNLPNVLLLHYARLKQDTPGEIRRIAGFLDIPIDKDTWPLILAHSSMEYMRDNGNKIVPIEGAFWTHGAKTFIHKGTNGRWKDTLTHEDNHRYLKTAEAKLGAECARWLETGE